MGRLSVLASSATVVSFASAFCVDFNSGERCTGTVVGRSGVAFFGQPDCEVFIGFGNVPLCTGVGAWSSFKVITIDEAADQLTNLDPAPILPIPSNATAAVGRGDRFAVPSGMPEDVTGTARIPGPSSTTVASTSSETSTAVGPTGAGTTTTTSDGMITTMGIVTSGKIRRTSRPNLSKRVAHGSTHQHQGRTYKYHQVAARAWRGVPVEEWNDQIHKRDTRGHVSHAKRGQLPARHHARAIGPVGGSDYDSVKRGICPRSPSPLNPRVISPSRCNLVRSCMIDTDDNDNFGISDAGPALLRALETVNPNSTSWQYLREPFVVETIEHAGVASCSDAGSESDAFKSALEMGVAGSKVTDMRVEFEVADGRWGDELVVCVYEEVFPIQQVSQNLLPRSHPIMPFHFFSLPPELRNMVYIEVLASSTDTETARTQYLHGHTPFLPCSIPTSLFLTNRQIHTEASPLLWTHRFWQSRICYDSTLFDFREPLWNLPPPSLLPFIQNLEITLRTPCINDYVLEPEDPLKRQKEISGTMAKLLAILVDEVVSHRPGNYPYLKAVLVHLPCICPRCDNPDDLGEDDRGPFWEPPDREWKAGVTAHSLSVLLHPLRRLRVSQKLEFRFDCRHSGFPGAFEPVFAGIASVVVGETPVEALS
ncbi:MAG: hypothetical protein Q9199_008183, partial [Rusavskia elegans]